MMISNSVLLGNEAEIKKRRMLLTYHLMALNVDIENVLVNSSTNGTSNC